MDSYKYLGVALNSILDSDQQWDRVRASTRSLPFLLKQLKLAGWSQSMLISAYRAYGLSHFVYSAPILTSASMSSKRDMQTFQNRILRITGLTQAEATALHNIPPILDRIDEICARTILKILADSDHPITMSLSRTSRSNQPFPFVIPRARHEHYSNTFLLKYLRFARDGSTNLYLPR